jgi:microcompartment protein CcmL/EutN
MNCALAMIELDSIALGLRALDALVKKAPVQVLEANLVEPGRYLILFTGGVAEVEESYAEAREIGSSCILDEMLLSQAHPGLVDGLRGLEDVRSADEMDTLGVVEGRSVAATLKACDRSLKDAQIRLAGIRLAGGLGGKAYYLVFGAQHDVEIAIERGGYILGERLLRTEIIARPHSEMVRWLLRRAPFGLEG